MNSINLRIRDINILNDIRKALYKHQSLSIEQQDILSEFLLNLPKAVSLLKEKVPLNQTINVELLETDKISPVLKKWEALFNNLPGWDFCPICYIVDKDDLDALKENVLIIAIFSPSYSYNLIHKGEGYEVWLKSDGTSQFKLPSLEDAELFPELYNFKGSWKEAYLLLIETLQKGWPMEEFPKELQKFLPSK